jgi:hypothetical protein
MVCYSSFLETSPSLLLNKKNQLAIDSDSLNSLRENPSTSHGVHDCEKFLTYLNLDFVRSILLEIQSPRPSLLLTFIYNSIPYVELVLAWRSKMLRMTCRLLKLKVMHHLGHLELILFMIIT